MATNQHKKARKAARSSIESCESRLQGLTAEIDRLPPLAGHRRYLEVALEILGEAFGAYRSQLEGSTSDSSSETSADLRQKILREAFNEAFTHGSDDLREESITPDDDDGKFCFSGALFSVPEILQFLSFNKKTGTATISCTGETFSIELEEGSVIDARSTNSPAGCRLGEILVQQGVVTQEALNSFIGSGASEGDLIGHGLSSDSLVTRDQLVDALRIQMQRLFNRCIEADGCDVNFRPRFGPYEPTDLHVDLIGLLLEGAVLSDTPC